MDTIVATSACMSVCLPTDSPRAWALGSRGSGVRPSHLWINRRESISRGACQRKGSDLTRRRSKPQPKHRKKRKQPVGAMAAVTAFSSKLVLSSRAPTAALRKHKFVSSSSSPLSSSSSPSIVGLSLQSDFLRRRAARVLLGESCRRTPSAGVVMASTDAGSAGVTVQKSEEEWRTVLSPEQFRILRQKGTEYAGTGKYNKFKEDGLYECAGCGTPLYKSTTKFDSGCGWPAFYEGLPGAIKETVDADGRRIEITCAACGGHLGHVFKNEGFSTSTNERHCVNSISLKFTPANL